MKTLNIAICEDIPQDIEVLRGIIRKSGVSANVFSFENGEVFLAAYKPGFFQVVLLDMYLHEPAKSHSNNEVSGLTGLDIATRIRESDEDAWLVFTTVSPDQAIAGYRVKAERYLLKPVDEEEVLALLHRAAMHWENVHHEIHITVARKRRPIRSCDILYIEVRGRQSFIHTKDEVLVSYITIDDLESRLPFPPFLRCHRSFIVNMDYVKQADRDFQMTNGDLVHIGRSNQWRIKAQYHSYIVRLAREGGL